MERRYLSDHPSQNTRDSGSTETKEKTENIKIKKMKTKIIKSKRLKNK